MKEITARVLVLAATALVVACGGDGGGEPVGPGGTIGASSAIAFVGNTPDSPAPDLYLIDADNGAVQQLTDTQDLEWWPAWSRDRQHMGFIVSPARQGEQQATTPAGDTTTPAEDATESIAQQHLVVANGDGTNRRPIAGSVPLQSYSGGFSWSPAGDEIIYTAVESTDEALRAMLRRVSVTEGRDLPLAEERLGYLPAWSPDGTKIVFAAFVGELDEQGNGESELFLMDRDGGNLRQITDRTGTDVAPSWSPDGTRIVWWGEKPTSDPEQSSSFILMIDLASGEITELGEGASPVWSPVGEQILFVHEEDPPAGQAPLQANTEIYTIDVATGARKRLTEEAAPDRGPVWSADGQRIAFVSLRDHLLGEIYVINADGSNARRLTDNKVQEAMLAWAPQ